MTRKDYILIAAALLRSRQTLARDPAYTHAMYDALDHVTRELATALESTNPLFDRARFIAAATTGAKP